MVIWTELFQDHQGVRQAHSGHVCLRAARQRPAQDGYGGKVCCMAQGRAVSHRVASGTFERHLGSQMMHRKTVKMYQERARAWCSLVLIALHWTHRSFVDGPNMHIYTTWSASIVVAVVVLALCKAAKHGLFGQGALVLSSQCDGLACGQALLQLQCGKAVVVTCRMRSVHAHQCGSWNNQEPQ